ncbi:AsnC family transcriptional regulator [Candidatus Bathyarchaeota archaeon]|jgi:DNA-binding Lrp family transcriptional regulator|nr:AsnC family transcriptional regulator [Candidatus Bathyarchaeota archaeon]MBT5643167.1 AsnC family transcriptional regulator [Candidatus Bathyarchaeota archaeon]MBT7186742.1 AsnC family transcriptional regulator [Candidatus Bathyarchaeota archaeon]MBT7345584.1 AsnC family transcriptional regulator [Candidatus Bathyarchaeota archaeon]
MALDDMDLSITKLLRQNPRMPYTKIADTLGISRVTVKHRIDKMLAEELIILSARTNIKNQGGKMAMLGLEVKSEDLWDECMLKLNSLPWVLMGFKAMGKSNLRVLIYGETDEILERNIDDFRYYHCVNFIEVEILGKPIVGPY